MQNFWNIFPSILEPVFLRWKIGYSYLWWLIRGTDLAFRASKLVIREVSDNVLNKQMGLILLTSAMPGLNRIINFKFVTCILASSLFATASKFLALCSWKKQKLHGLSFNCDVIFWFTKMLIYDHVSSNGYLISVSTPLTLSELVETSGIFWIKDLARLLQLQFGRLSCKILRENHSIMTAVVNSLYKQAFS